MGKAKGHREHPPVMHGVRHTTGSFLEANFIVTDIEPVRQESRRQLTYAIRFASWLGKIPDDRHRRSKPGPRAVQRLRMGSDCMHVLPGFGDRDWESKRTKSYHASCRIEHDSPGLGIIHDAQLST
jgi:hypothetical protein